jgi:ADP-dependent NAD(P)H-hydrate dehydratase / NAD(P)H-hydrate epimerase
MKSITWNAAKSKKCLVVPKSYDHKYSRGVLGVITGSAQYPGAAVLSTKAAVATGIGMVRFYSSSGLAHLVLHESPEVVVQPGAVTTWLAGSGIVEDRFDDYTTWLRHRWFKVIERQSVPTVLDAGALGLAGKLSQPTLITPHAGELSRILKRLGTNVSADEISDYPIEWASEVANQLDVTVLLKGSKSVVVNNEIQIQLPAATPWLATAGSGDVLGGIIGAIAASNEIEILNSDSRFAEIAASASFIHDQSARLASKGGPISASSIITRIPEAVRKILG